MKLISMTDFVISQNILLANKEITYNECGLRILKYANFLKQPLKLGMFVPCDKDGSVLEEPSHFELYKLGIAPDESQIIECGIYEKAKNKILFSNDFECIKKSYYYLICLNKNALWVSWNSNRIIEEYINCNLDLSKSAIKQLGL